MQQRGHGRLHPFRLTYAVLGLVTDLAFALVHPVGEDPPFADDGVVIHQRIQGVFHGVAAHQHHPYGIQVADLQGQPELDSHQWILGLLAEAFPDLSLQCQADTVLFADRLLQFGGQGKAQLLSRLADRLGKAHCHGGGVRHGGAIVVRSDIRSRINRGKVPNWP